MANNKNAHTNYLILWIVGRAELLGSLPLKAVKKF